MTNVGLMTQISVIKKNHENPLNLSPLSEGKSFSIRGSSEAFLVKAFTGVGPGYY